MYTIDTNIIIYYRNGEPAVLSFLREQLDQGAALYVSTATVHELYSYPRLTPDEMQKIDALLDTLTVIDIDIRLAQLSGQLRSAHGIRALDSMIAATALMTGTTIATRNVRDFRRVPGLQIHEL